MPEVYEKQIFVLIFYIISCWIIFSMSTYKNILSSLIIAKTNSKNS